MSGLFDQIKDKATELLGQGKGAADAATSSAAGAAGGAKGAVGAAGAVVSGGVHKAGDFVDEKTGGKSAPVTGAVEGAIDSAVDKLSGDDSSAT